MPPLCTVSEPTVPEPPRVAPCIAPVAAISRFPLPLMVPVGAGLLKLSWPMSSAQSPRLLLAVAFSSPENVRAVLLDLTGRVSDAQLMAVAQLLSRLPL